MTQVKHQESNYEFSNTRLATDFDHIACISQFAAQVSDLYWHRHSGMQVLIATDGTGYYQEKGKPVQLLHSGDVVFILPDVEHWHTADDECDFTNISIGGPGRNELVTWLQKTFPQQTGL